MEMINNTNAVTSADNEPAYKELSVISRAGSIRKKPDTIRIAIRTKQYAIRIDDTIQR